MATSEKIAARVAAPDTKLAREATDLVRETTSALIYNHSRRVFWGAACRAATEGSVSTRSCSISGRCSTTSA